MAIGRPKSTHPATTGPRRVAGLNVILLGLVCFVVSRLFDGGFLKGLFTGATIALMVLGAYIVGARTWHGRRNEQDLEDGQRWLPSRDNATDRTDR